MQILGIPLVTPSSRSLLEVAGTALATAMLGTLAVSAGYFNFGNAVTLTLGVMGGNLASAYGVNPREQGWRGYFVVALFVLTLLGVAGLAMLLAG